MESVYSFIQNILNWKFFTVIEVRKNRETLEFIALHLDISNFLDRKIVSDRREANL